MFVVVVVAAVVVAAAAGAVGKQSSRNKLLLPLKTLCDFLVAAMAVAVDAIRFCGRCLLLLPITVWLPSRLDSVLLPILSLSLYLTRPVFVSPTLSSWKISPILLFWLSVLKFLIPSQHLAKKFSPIIFFLTLDLQQKNDDDVDADNGEIETKIFFELFFSKPSLHFYSFFFFFIKQ